MAWYLADNDPLDDLYLSFTDLPAEHTSDHDSELSPFGSELTADTERHLDVLSDCRPEDDMTRFCMKSQPASELSLLSLGCCVDIAPVPSPSKKEADILSHADVAMPDTQDSSLTSDAGLMDVVQKQIDDRINRAHVKATAEKLELRRKLKHSEQNRTSALSSALRAKLRSRNEAAVSRRFKVSMNGFLMDELKEAVKENLCLRQRLRSLEERSDFLSCNCGPSF